MTRFLPGVCVAIVCLQGASAMMAHEDAAAPLRAPATPLVVHDPYFSIWSAADRLTDAPTSHWSATPRGAAGDLHVDHPQPLDGFVQVDGKNYRYLGDSHAGGTGFPRWRRLDDRSPQRKPSSPCRVPRSS